MHDTRYAYTLPRSVDCFGDEQEQGRYALAHSRDGWFVIDAENMLVLSWHASEDDADAARATHLNTLS